MGVNRIELSDFTKATKDRLKANSFCSEITSWKLRQFCQTDASSATVLDRNHKRCNVMEIHK